MADLPFPARDEFALIQGTRGWTPEMHMKRGYAEQQWPHNLYADMNILSTYLSEPRTNQNDNGSD